MHQIHFHVCDLLKDERGKIDFHANFCMVCLGFFNGQKMQDFSQFSRPKNTARHENQNNTPKAKSDFEDKDNLFVTICVVLTVKDSFGYWSFEKLLILT